MKKTLILAATLTLLTATACTQKSETEVSTDTSGSVTSTHVESTTAPAVDTAATAAATDAANDAAHATGTAMETAGQAIQEETKTVTKGWSAGGPRRLMPAASRAAALMVVEWRRGTPALHLVQLRQFLADLVVQIGWGAVKHAHHPSFAVREEQRRHCR
ncbi:MAG: hypothetical protein ACJ74H_16645 [Thermoanaerobaculia bacterium]